MKKLILGLLTSTIIFSGASLVFAQTYSGSSYTTSYAAIGQTGSAPGYGQACSQLTMQLYRGATDSYTAGQVTLLQQFLASRFPGQLVTGYFGAVTQANVVLFQRQQGLTPVGIVGPYTRAAINAVCRTVSNGNRGQLPITNVSGPNSLTVGQQGTWNITTNAAYGSNVSVSVRWGDENVYAYGAMAPAAMQISQQNSFSHAYQSAGTFTITFTATDSAGNTNSATASVFVGGTNFSASPISGQSPLAVWFTSTGSSGSNIGTAVNFGDGTTGTLNGAPVCATCNPQSSVSHTYTAPGTYTATLLSRYPQNFMCMTSNPNCNALGTVTITVY